MDTTTTSAAEPTTMTTPVAGMAASSRKPLEPSAIAGDPSAAELLPDPSRLVERGDAAPPSLAPGEADDLIARMADQQIDQMISDAEAKPVAAEQSAEDEPVAPEPAAPLVERRNMVPPAGGFPASFSPPQAASRRLAEVPPIEAPPAAAVVEPEVFSAVPLAAEREPATAELPRAALAESPPTEVSESTDAPLDDAHEALQSDADEVARELAEDLALSPRRAAAPTAVVPAAANHVHSDHTDTDLDADVEATDGVFGRLVHALGVVPTAIVDLINLPVRGAGDGVREAIGATAIITLANATALLLYLMLFR